MAVFGLLPANLPSPFFSTRSCSIHRLLDEVCKHEISLHCHTRNVLWSVATATVDVRAVLALCSTTHF